MIKFYVVFFWFFLCYFGNITVSFFKNQVWVCLATFWCFIISFLDFIIVFKRINYPVLSWVYPLDTVGFLFLVMLLFYDLWCLVSCVG